VAHKDTSLHSEDIYNLKIFLPSISRIMASEGICFRSAHYAHKASEIGLGDFMSVVMNHYTGVKHEKYTSCGPFEGSGDSFTEEVYQTVNVKDCIPLQSTTTLRRV
jgi:hypothetical protein